MKCDVWITQGSILAAERAWRRGDTGFLLCEEHVVCHTSSSKLSQTARTVTGVPPGKDIRRAALRPPLPHREVTCLLASSPGSGGTLRQPCFSQRLGAPPPVTIIGPRVSLQAPSSLRASSLPSTAPSGQASRSRGRARRHSRPYRTPCVPGAQRLSTQHPEGSVPQTSGREGVTE